MIEWYKKVVFENYANFNGRAMKVEYWSFFAVNAIINLSFFILTFIFSIISDSLGGIISIASSLYGLAIIVPSLAACVRRLHDIGKSGWAVLVALIPLVGLIVLIIWLASDGKPGINEYGVNPKEEFDIIDEIGQN